MMNSAQTKAWAILTEEEKIALTLATVQNKSTWEAGEIMNKAHYKYLEISQRAEKFFKMFTAYFTNYDRLIPVHANISPSFRKYITFLIEGRNNLMDTVAKINDENYKKPKLREKEITVGVNYLKNSPITQEQNFYHLIMDFDRWNNFRILPVSIQEPSAFKRRNKHKLRKLVNLFTSLHPLAIEKLIQLYGVKRQQATKEYCFLPLITVHDQEMTQVIKVSLNEENIRKMNNLVLYIFRYEHDAQDFLNILTGYVFKDRKHCRDGQEFWPEFRILTQKAINFDQIQNITPSRKFVMENASIDRETKWFLSKKAREEDDYFSKRQSRVKKGVYSK